MKLRLLVFIRLFKRKKNSNYFNKKDGGKYEKIIDFSIC